MIKYVFFLFFPLILSAQTILILGDSISRGYYVEQNQSYAAILQQKLPQAEILNLSIGGLLAMVSHEALDNYLLIMDPKIKIDALIIALGINDAGHKIDTNLIFHGLNRTIELAKQKGIRVLLGIVDITSRQDPWYTFQFNSIYSNLANKYQLETFEFLNPQIYQFHAGDCIHLNVQGHRMIAENILSRF